MYHTIIRHKLRQAFLQLNRQEYSGILAGFGANAEHTFYGVHALGGARRTRGAIRKWYDRLPRVLPDLHFTIRQIAVSGWPWNTVAAVEWQDRGVALDG